MELKKNTLNAQVTLVLFALLAIIQLLGVYLLYLINDTVKRSLNGEIADEYGAYELEDYATKLSYVETAMLVLIIFFFIRWFWFSYSNLREMGCKTQYTSGWAIGAWFVPVMNLFVPAQIMSDNWKYYHRLAKYKSFEGQVSTALVGFWWAFYLIKTFATQAAERYSDSVETIDQALLLTYFGIIAAGLNLISILLTMQLIMRLSKKESEVQGMIETGELKFGDDPTEEPEPGQKPQQEITQQAE